MLVTRAGAGDNTRNRHAVQNAAIAASRLHLAMANTAERPPYVYISAYRQRADHTGCSIGVANHNDELNPNSIGLNIGLVQGHAYMQKAYDGPCNECNVI